MTACAATGESKEVPGHTHTCVGGDAHDAHYCGECLRWWKITHRPRRVRPPKKTT